MHPIIAKFGPITIYSYGVMVALGYFIVFFLSRKKAVRMGIDPDIMTDVTLIAMISGLIGARLLYVTTHFDYYAGHLLDIIMIHRGGLVFYGGPPVALISCIVFLRRKNHSVMPIADLLAPYLALGHAVGRLGCFLNGCCYGTHARYPWGLYFPHTGYVHPTQLYANVLLLILFFALNYLYTKPHRVGSIFVAYIGLYSVLRFFLELLRGDTLPVVGGLTLAQLIAIGCMVGAGVYFAVIQIKNHTSFRHQT